MDTQKEFPCREAHKIDGIIPQKTDLHFDGRTCDCGKIIFYKERCGCPANVTPTYDLKSKPNPNYVSR